MADLPAIERALGLVEANLCQPLTVADMARAAGYSLFHFCRCFVEATHHTPYDYLMRRRLTEAARAMLARDDRLLDLALDLQFASPETFARAFKRMFGLQPSQMRKQGQIDPRQLMPRLTLAHLRQIAGAAYLRPAAAARPALQVLGVTALIGEDRVGVPALWSMLLRARPTDLPGPATYCGVATYQQGWEKEGLLYTAGVEVQDPRPQPVLGYRRLPAQECACFVHRGPAAALPLTMDYVYSTWLPRSGRSLAQPWIVEIYATAPTADAAQAEIEVWVPIR